MNNSEKKQILIYDTTLRDGSQAEGVSFTVTAKLRVAEKLDQFGVDYIEGGWPGSNPRDMAFFEKATDLNLKHAKIAAFGSTRRASSAVEEDPQIKLLLDANTPVVTIFGKSWLLHVTDVLRTTPAENLAMIEDSVRYLKEQGKEVVYDAEHFFDGYTDNPEYALSTLTAAEKGGADFLVLCETNGGKLVPQVQEITQTVVDKFPTTPIGMHCHNDAGVGVAVSLTGIEVGAKMIQGTMNGYGERNGNANLTTIIPNLELKMKRKTNCSENLSKLRDISFFIDDSTNLRPDIRSPYVGAASFAHKGGVHADAASKSTRSYEHIDPALVGNRTRVLVSDMSGRSSIMMKAKEMGMEVDGRSPEMKSFLEELKRLEFQGYEFEAADASFDLLLKRFLRGEESAFNILRYHVGVSREEGSDESKSEATVKLMVKDEIRHTVAEGNGPVSALDHALRKALEKDFPFIQEVRLVDFTVRILESNLGTDAITRVHVESTDGKKTWGTVGVSDNVITASWEALVDSVSHKIQMES
ncbi:MAG: citramalate synthase [Opitutae bacterium]|nr:citramalate synthase [Opitutae bacterium]MBT5717763.1 citramalate synthase [Opitutae bacterium]